MSSALTPAVIVMRHFLDLPDPPPPWPGPYCYKMPSGPSIEIPWRRLNPDGIKASLNYGTALVKLTQDLNLCPVSRVITQDPRSKEQTQNPFDTVYPFLFNQNLQDVRLLPSGSALLSTRHDVLLPDQSHSTLICWDRQTLWGDKQFDRTLFLGQMRRSGGPSLDAPPVKAPTKSPQGIYVFTNYKSEDDRFDLRTYPTFTELAGQGPQPTQGPC
ncbi:MAG TPA: hypothetical protein VGS22_01625 [Thermoanaerobaculia bacterium]|jgi:hypothetical protein|nr:hypothetical protein [Thermoanaerobaculia bacterium]